MTRVLRESWKSLTGIVTCDCDALSCCRSQTIISTCVTSRHGNSSSHEERSSNNKGLHNVGDKEAWVKLGLLLAGESYMWWGCQWPEPLVRAPGARDTAVEICAPKTWTWEAFSKTHRNEGLTLLPPEENMVWTNGATRDTGYWDCSLEWNKNAPTYTTHLLGWGPSATTYCVGLISKSISLLFDWALKMHWW